MERAMKWSLIICFKELLQRSLFLPEGVPEYSTRVNTGETGTWINPWVKGELQIGQFGAVTKPTDPP